MKTPRTKNMSLSDYLDMVIELKNDDDENKNISEGKESMQDVLDVLVKDTDYSPISKRLGKYLENNHREIKSFENTFHKQHFSKLITNEDFSDRELIAALYLLTAEDKTWRAVREHVSRSGIKYDLVSPIPSDEGYTLFKLAQDITDGEKHITLRDIADCRVLTSQMFLLICKAIAISLYGSGAVGIKPKNPREEVVIFKLIK